MAGVYIFPSHSKRNIEIAVKRGMWAVPIHSCSPSIAGKAKSMEVNDRVLLYLNSAKDLYGLFRITETPNPDRVISDVWDGNFGLPFRFEKCADIVRAVHAPDLMNILPSYRGLTGAWSNHFTRFRGLTIFTKQPMTEMDMTALSREYSSPHRPAL